MIPLSYIKNINMLRLDVVTYVIIGVSLLPHQNRGPTIDFILVGTYGTDVDSHLLFLVYS